MAAGVFNTMRLTSESVAVTVLGVLLATITQARLAATYGADTADDVTAQLLQGEINCPARGRDFPVGGQLISLVARSGGGAPGCGLGG